MNNVGMLIKSSCGFKSLFAYFAFEKFHRLIPPKFGHVVFVSGSANLANVPYV